MGEVVEVLFTSTFNNDRATCTVHDLRTGTELMKYKGGGAMQPNSLGMLGRHHIMAANSMKPLLHVWPINGQEQMTSIRFVVPGRVSALALTPDGEFLVAGIQESLYIWHMNTGRLLNVLNKHYQQITVVRFTDNGEHFVSAGKDGAVLMWNLTYAVTPMDMDESVTNSPVYSFNDHGLTVTDVHIGVGGRGSYMYTVSLDRCCKIYDLATGTLLLTVVFPLALHSVIADPLETHMFVGTDDGHVHVFHLERVPRMKEYHVEESKILSFSGGHTAGLAVTCLALSSNAQQLISGGDDKQVCIWHVESRQLLKTMLQTGTVTNLRVRLITPKIFQPEVKYPQLFAEKLMRMITPPDDDECIELLITEDCTLGRTTPTYNYRDEDLIFELGGDPTNYFNNALGSEAEEEAEEESDDDSDDEISEPPTRAGNRKNKTKKLNQDKEIVTVVDDENQSDEETATSKYADNARAKKRNQVAEIASVDDEKSSDGEIADLGPSCSTKRKAKKSPKSMPETDSFMETDSGEEIDQTEQCPGPSNSKKAKVKIPLGSKPNTCDTHFSKGRLPSPPRTTTSDELSTSKEATSSTKLSTSDVDVDALIKENKKLKQYSNKLYEFTYKYIIDRPDPDKASTDKEAKPSRQIE
ncbi:WD repeat-containing protein 18 [Scaptodrosophila lebanonensis]|uniref:WD repeat-containing protein 18 n=1 Tax=Drosophila lebanonensis TaxID=7225 RepID=A0A6J2TWL4_DROLE|nr:WD repeat-containing protein 18 [Scaptodrosophila lebanonensis]